MQVCRIIIASSHTYGSIIKYSGFVWGKEPHPEDLSHCASYEDFLVKMRLVMENAYDALSCGSRYSVLIGDIRKSNEYTSIQADLLQIAPGKLESIIIKAQHNCQSDKKVFSNESFLRIAHEYLITIKRDKFVIGFLDNTLKTSRKLKMLSNVTWKSLIHAAFSKIGSRASLSELYAAIAVMSPEKTANNVNWRARIRVVLQENFTPLERGVWSIA